MKEPDVTKAVQVAMSHKFPLSGLVYRRDGMGMPAVKYKSYRFPAEIIAHAVWLYHRLTLSLLHVEEMPLDRGIVVSYETIRRWGRKFGPDYAGRLRRKRLDRNDVWHLDEIVHTRRNTKAAGHLLTKLLKKQGLAPKRMITDKLRSDGADRRQVVPNVEHRLYQGLNNRAENSHGPLRKRERSIQGFRSPGSLQRFISIFSAVRNLFVPSSSQRSALGIHIHRLQAIAKWKSVSGIS